MKNIEKKILEKINKDSLLSFIAHAAAEHKVHLYLVGGFIRDAILKSRTKDIDCAVIKGKTGFYKSLEESSRHRIITFRKKGIINKRLIIEGRIFDFVDATTKGIEQELARRDFTINSIAFSLKDKKIVDLQNGLADLKKRTFRMNKKSAFRSDPLRMVRAVRLCCEKEGFTIEEETYRQIESNPGIIGRVSGERIKEELDRIMESPHAMRGILLLHETGLLKIILPELTLLQNIPQGRRHFLDAWNHTLRALSCADAHRKLFASLKIKPLMDRESTLLLKYALLFHDIAKAQTFSEDENGDIHFFNHEKLSADVASRIMKRLRFSAKFSDDVKKLIELHLRPHFLAEAEPSDRAIARLIAESKELTELLALHSLADALGTEKHAASLKIMRLKKLLARVLTVYQSRGKEISSPKKLVSGNDVMKILGLPEGPDVGTILKKIHELQITGEVTTRAQALRYVSSFLK